jgi:hypothetical protein
MIEHDEYSLLVPSSFGGQEGWDGEEEQAAMVALQVGRCPARSLTPTPAACAPARQAVAEQLGRRPRALTAWQGQECCLSSARRAGASTAAAAPPPPPPRRTSLWCLGAHCRGLS